MSQKSNPLCCRNEILYHSSFKVRCDHHNSVLSKTLCYLPCNSRSTTKNCLTIPSYGRLVNLHDKAILSASTPSTTCFDVSNIRKVSTNNPFHIIEKRLTIKSRGDTFVSALPEARRNAGADVKTNSASGRKVSRSHSSNIAEGREILEKKAGKKNGQFWIYFAFDENENLIIETSFLPDIPEVQKELKPLGFKRRKDGAYEVKISPKEQDQISVLRKVTKAVNILLKEGYL